MGLMLIVNNGFAKVSCDEYTAFLATFVQSKEIPVDTINQIEHVLGKTIPAPITQKQYTWKDFTIIVRDENIVKVYGKIPPIYQNAITTPTLEEAVMSLGQPKVGPQQDLDQYHWICDGYGSVLTVYTEKNGKVIAYDGLVCNSNIKNCTTFDSVKFNVSAFQVPQ